ncbi:alpha/beta fold hydrolase [Streptomyces sp. NBC_00690]|uniref:alpha/beta fold hydrolase n=1 Tax=Streptomyces sp. NBC_00690 TaxID=2975808 RepID=UPI002E2C92FD|nr:alpha/beta hydrolase [Streptomyces sp. NBC_00690]
MTSGRHDHDYWADLDSMRVRYRRAGTGPPLLLLHGSGSSLEAFDRIAPPLHTDHDVIRPDLPGFGLTGPRPDRDYRITTYAAFLARLIDALAVKTCSVAGHSLGGNIAWNLALDHPGRVDRLILMNATGYPGKTLPLAMRLARNPLTRPLLRRAGSRRATAATLRSAAGSAFTVPDTLIDRTHAMTGRPGNRQAFIDLARTDQPDRTAHLSDITAPTLVLYGENIDGQHFARDIPDSREAVLPGVGHLMPEEAPEAVTTAVRTFLEPLP